MSDKETARKKIAELLRAARTEAAAAGLELTVQHEIRDPEQEKLKAKMQANLNSARSQIEAAIECAKELGLRRLDFLGGFIMWAYEGRMAVGGPRVFSEEWRSSDFDCYPTDSDWEWLHGPNPPPKPYEEAQYNFDDPPF